MKGFIRITLLLITVISAVIALGIPKMNQDLYMAFCSGRDILKGSLDGPNDWSFMAHGQVWVDQAWLPHVIFYLSYLGMGTLGPVLIHALLLLTTLSLTYGQCRRADVSIEWSLIAVTLAALSLAPFVTIRGEAFGLVCFALLFSTVSARPSHAKVSQGAAVAILVLWSNSHASFILGFFLVLLRSLCDLVSHVALLQRAKRSEVTEKTEVPGPVDRALTWIGALPPPELNESQRSAPRPLGWLITLLVSIVLAAYLNPYGPENLWIPFKQFADSSVSVANVRWAQWGSLAGFLGSPVKRFMSHGSAWPFLVLLSMFFCSLIAVFFTRFRDAKALVKQSRPRSDILMIVITPLVLVPLVLILLRAVPFWSLSVAPVLGMFLDSLFRSSGDPAFARPTHASRPFSSVIVAGICALGLTGVSLLCHRYVIVHYLTDNPMKSASANRPFIDQVMNYGMDYADVAGFLERNKIGGKCYANEFLSNFLLFHVPGISLFLDLRAQSYFPPKVIETYAKIQIAGTVAGGEGTELLDQYRVDIVVLDCTFVPFGDLAIELMKTRRWACSYNDKRCIVLVRPDSERFRANCESGNLQDLWFGNQQTRVLSEATLNYFMKGMIDAPILEQLRLEVERTPDDFTYTLIVYAMNGSSRCLNAPSREFLLEQAKKLTNIDAHFSPGLRNRVRALVKILSMLEFDEEACRRGTRSRDYRVQRARWTAFLAELNDRFGL
jgi:hypothetical protein